MTKKSSAVLKKVLKLPPAVGDWTKLKKEEARTAEGEGKYFPKLPPEVCDQLHFYHYELAQNLEQKFNNFFQVPVSLHSVKLEQLKFSAFLEDAGHTLIQQNFKIGPSEVFFGLEPALGEALIDSALGGRAHDLTQTLNLTEIEKTILEKIFNEVIVEYKHIFGASLPVEISPSPIIADGPKISSLAGESFFLAITLTLNIGTATPGRIFLGYSEEALKPLLESLSQIGNNKTRTVLLEEKTLEGILVPVKAELGTTTLTTGELAKISVGDVVSLDKKAGNPVYVIIGNEIKLKGNLGVYEGRLSLQIGREGRGSQLFQEKEIDQEPPAAFRVPGKIKEKEEIPKMAREELFDNEIESKLEKFGVEEAPKEEEDLYSDEVKKKEPVTEEEEMEDYGFSLEEE